MNRAAAARLMFAALGVALAVSPLVADDTILNSPHDLSVYGPGPVRAVNEDRVCVFCHAPHNTSPQAPLWNRHNPTTHYRIYRSSTTDARIDQPGPASKQCLSCHDGSIALGLTLDRPITDPIPMTHPFMPSGQSNLTNDLSDDHPIGLRFDRALSNRDPQLRQPQLVDHRIHLGDRGELECTACHDPHNNELGNFLRITDREGALCNTCHQLAGWRTSSHALSGATVPVAATNGIRLPYRSMSENACRSCHESHSAPVREKLLYDRDYRLCITCHDGLTATDILPVLNQASGHRVSPIAARRTDARRRSPLDRFVECSDCHNPHAVAGGNFAATLNPTGAGPVVAPPAMREVSGVSISGAPVDEARLYYEVCFKCHADRPVITRDRVLRDQESNGNVRRQFLPTAASAHPVAFPARNNAETPSLRPELRGPRFISCQDCHNNPDAAGAGGLVANGPHTSRFEPLLARRYETADFTAESPQAYALCYDCHDRNSILGDESFSYHRVHIVNERTPCSACHTAHGVSGSATEHSHLINFDLSIVQGERFFQDTGRFSGSCTLTCHGVRHVNFVYPPGP